MGKMSKALIFLCISVIVTINITNGGKSTLISVKTFHELSNIHNKIKMLYNTTFLKENNQDFK